MYNAVKGCRWSPVTADVADMKIDSSQAGRSTGVRGPAANSRAAKHAPGDVPDDYTVVRGGAKAMPAAGEVFSGSAGPTLNDAAKGVPHGKLRAASAAGIYDRGGTVKVAPELSREGQVNYRHVDVVEGEAGAFGELIDNPVPKLDRIA